VKRRKHGVEQPFRSRIGIKPGGIILSYESFMLVSDMVRAHALEPITLKGITHSVVPYAVGDTDAEGEAERPVITEHTPGLDLFLDVRALRPASASALPGRWRARSLL